MGRKVYHIWQYFNDDEIYMGSKPSVKKAIRIAEEMHNIYKDYKGYKSTVVSSFDMKTAEHLDIWFSSFLKMKEVK
jgi:hypothetical protein